MKVFKKLATLSMALMFVLGLGALTACGGNGDSATSSTTSTPNTSTTSSVEASSNTASTEDKSEAEASSEEEKIYEYYEFLVLNADGSKASGCKVQLCTADNSNCYNPVEVVDGACVYNVIPNNTLGEYVVHVLDASYQQLALQEEVTTSADSFGLYTIQLAQ